MKLDRLIIQNIEGRIMLGIVMFVSIMILIGWVAINEPARMASFEEQHVGRSTERGAELFAANCSTCHGTAGYGQTGVAPALNNPHLFGYDFLADVNGDIARLQRRVRDEIQPRLIELAGDEDVTGERDMVFAELSQAAEDERDALIEQLNIIDEEIATLETQLDEIAVELEPLLQEREDILASMNQAILRGYYPSLDEIRITAEEEGDPFILTTYLAEDASRLTQVGWGGDLRSYINTTLVHGRPGSNDVWGGNARAMVAWSQRAGGPLRDDEIEDLVNYIVNWDKGDNWALADLDAVGQFARLHAPYQFNPEGGEGVTAIGNDVDEILASLEGVTGDVARGEQLYTGMAQSELNQLVGCSSCHAGGAVGPATEGTWSRVEAERLVLPEFADYSIEEYIIESIVRPADYAVPGYAGAMPLIYGDQMSAQDMADILAYIEAQG